jgi:hypothetical protein
VILETREKIELESKKDPNRTVAPEIKTLEGNVSFFSSKWIVSKADAF